MRVRCENCDWIGGEAELLRASHPFEPTNTVTGCPRCKDVESTIGVCDEPGCDEFVSCGMPTENGYRTTCGRHMPTPRGMKHAPSAS